MRGFFPDAFALAKADGGQVAASFGRVLDRTSLASPEAKLGPYQGSSFARDALCRVLDWTTILGFAVKAKVN